MAQKKDNTTVIAFAILLIAVAGLGMLLYRDGASDGGSVSQTLYATLGEVESNLGISCTQIDAGTMNAVDFASNPSVQAEVSSELDCRTLTYNRGLVFTCTNADICLYHYDIVDSIPDSDSLCGAQFQASWWDYSDLTTDDDGRSGTKICTSYTGKIKKVDIQTGYSGCPMDRRNPTLSNEEGVLKNGDKTVIDSSADDIVRITYTKYDCGLGGFITDSDDDGVIDDNDLCPDTPFGETVGPNGCSCTQLDTDNDGVNNCDDQCPGTVAGAVVDNVGCEVIGGVDSDGDSVEDSSDLCPNTPSSEVGNVDNNGCAPSERDTDGDGLNDNLDACPTLAGTIGNNGCPADVVPPSNGQVTPTPVVPIADSDGDGVEDSQDLCPNTSNVEVADENGCGLSQKDTDNDGVVDSIDFCPDESGPAENLGCPIEGGFAPNTQLVILVLVIIVIIVGLVWILLKKD